MKVSRFGQCNNTLKLCLVLKFTLSQASWPWRGGRGITMPTLNLGTRRGWVVSNMPQQLYPPGKTWYPLYRRLSGPQGRSGHVQKIPPPTGIRSPDRPARSQLLYRLSYPAHLKLCIYVWNFVSMYARHFSKFTLFPTAVSHLHIHSVTMLWSKECTLSLWTDIFIMVTYDSHKAGAITITNTEMTTCCNQITTIICSFYFNVYSWPVHHTHTHTHWHTRTHTHTPNQELHVWPHLPTIYHTNTQLYCILSI
jgi:hypothetical protein